MQLLTVRFGWIGNKESNHGHGTQGHHAADTKKETHQGIIYAGRIPSQPSVVPGGCNGQWIHADCHSNICYCQVDRQQLRWLQEGRALHSCSKDGWISKDCQDGWERRISTDNNITQLAHLCNAYTYKGCEKCWSLAWDESLEDRTDWETSQNSASPRPTQYCADALKTHWWVSAMPCYETWFFCWRGNLFS